MEYTRLSTCQLVEGLPLQEIEKLFTSVRYKISRYEKDQPIFRLMDDAYRVAIILQGSVQAQKIFPSGNSMQMTVGQQGDMLGQAAMFSVQRKYPVELTALEPSELMMLDRENVLKLLHATYGFWTPSSRSWPPRPSNCDGVLSCCPIPVFSRRSRSFCFPAPCSRAVQSSRSPDPSQNGR